MYARDHLMKMNYKMTKLMVFNPGTACKKFARKHTKFSKWFKPSIKRTFTRFKPTRFCEVYARTDRFKNSHISYLTDILNTK